MYYSSIFYLQRVFASSAFIRTSFCIIGAIFLSTTQVFASTYEIESNDSIAGYGTEISIQNAPKSEDIVVLLKTPASNTLEEFSGKTNSKGEATIAIPKKNTYNAGKYEFVVVPKGFDFEDGTPYFFEIFPDDPSPTLSKIKTENVSLSTGKKGTVQVLVQDQYGNIIPDHRIQLISSRDEDTIVYQGDNRTDQKGSISFEISSDTEGNSKLSAIDQTASITFSDRINIIFYNNGASTAHSSRFSASMFGVGGDEDSNTENINLPKVTDFAIDFPNTVLVNSDENFMTVRAVNSNGETVKGFTGTVFIRIPNDANAQVPGENGKYTFKKRDQGEFTFSRSLIFSKTGTQKIEVFLYDLQNEKIDINIFGKKSVQVKADGEFDSKIITTDIKILSPENNSQSGSKDISVQGKSFQNSDVKIFLDDSPYKTISTGDNGEFSLIMNDLEEGKHSIYAQKDGTKKQSPVVKFTIDTSAPLLKSFIFSQQKFTPQEKGTLTVTTQEKASRVSMILNKEQYDMKNTSGNIWKYIFEAPEEIGTYAVKVAISDEYENNNIIPLNKEITVVKPIVSVDVLSGKFSPEKKSILLEWTKPEGLDPILYILQVGTSPDTLKKSKSISGSTLKMEYKNFSLGDKVYIALSPVNEKGEEEAMTNIVAIQTEKEKQPDPTFTLIGNDETIISQWEKTENIDHYQILYGLQSGVYLQTVDKPASATSDTAVDMISGKKYFVRLQAKDAMGTVVFDYGEKSVVVGKSQFHSAPKEKPQPYPEWVTQTGPTFFLFLGSIFFLTGGIIMSRREKKYH